MERTTQLNRQGMGCGYEPPPPPHVRVMPWQPPIAKLGFKHKLPVVCAGYTTNLPEVQEIARAHFWAAKSQLATFLRGTPADDPVLAYIEILDAEHEAMMRYWTTPVAEGGGRQ